MPAIEVEQLVVTYGEFEALHDLSFAVDAGEIVALLGPNGAGKTTAVETLEGLRRPRSGRVRVGGADPIAGHDELVEQLGVVLQHPGLYPMMTPARMLALFASYYESPADPHELAERLGLAHVLHSRSKQLSGGERQRLALTLALVGRPSILILDEPTAGVDPEGRVAVRELLAELRDGGVALLVTSHELAEVERVADRVVIIDEGRLLASGRPAELAAAHNDFSFTTAPGICLEELGLALQSRVVEAHPGEYRVAAVASPQLLATLTSWLAERDLLLGTLRRSGLEELYLSLVAAERPGEPLHPKSGRVTRRARRPKRPR